jgi:putative nucleotidyltransferase with HDIG domain
MENSTPVLLGKCLGNYRLTGSLGFGSMGHVYSAEHYVMGRKAAVKVLGAELSKNADVVERFINEARAVNEIQHPNVVQITDFGQMEDQYYLIMELLEGEMLSDYISQCGALSVEETVRIAAQIASALDAAHRRGIVHRDLKPDNIFLIEHEDYPLFVKILDFGVARLMRTMNRVADRLTEQGTIIGTPHYMSPEQCLGELEVGPLSDIYSLGVILYEMVCGELPFECNSLSRLLLAHINEIPAPPRNRRQNLPDYLNAAIIRALQKTPEARFASMHEFRMALLNEPPVEPRAATEKSRQSSPQPKPAVSPAEQTQVMPPRTALIKVKSDEPARKNNVVTQSTQIDPSEDMHDQFGLSESDQERPKRVGNKLADIIRERMLSQNLVFPTMPLVAIEGIRLSGDENVTFPMIAAVIAKDPLLAAQVLKVANSVAFLSTEKAKTLEQAVSRLGERQLRLLLIELSTHRVFQSRERRIRIAFDGIWEHSLAVALLSRSICATVGRGFDSDTTHLTGLLHDVGKPMVGSMLLEAERRLSVEEKRFMTPGLWMTVVDESHREVGKAIGRSWNMPEEVVEALEFCGEYDDKTPYQVRNMVTLANGIAKAAGYCLGTTDLEGNDSLIEHGLQLLGIEEEKVPLLLEDLGGQVESYFSGQKGQGEKKVSTRYTKKVEAV